MNSIESFPTMIELKKFLTDMEKKYGPAYKSWLNDYTTENRFYIAEEDRLISNEELSALGYC